MRTISSRGGAALLACACTLATALTAWADIKPRSVNVTVRDTDGSVVPNAAIVVRDDLAAGQNKLTTDANGAAVIELKTSKVVAVVMAEGFGELTIEMRLPEDATQLNVSLQKGGGQTHADASQVSTLSGMQSKEAPVKAGANSTLQNTLPSKEQRLADLKRQGSRRTAGDAGGIAGPGSDSCATPAIISGSGVFAYDTSVSTTDGLPHAACLFFGQNQIENDVWFCWTADCDGTATVVTCDDEFDDTKLAAYNTCAVCPPTDAELLACNDDFCSLESRITFPVLNGTSYMIRVGNFPGSLGAPGSLTITCTGGGPVGNDNCATPTAIAGPQTVNYDGTNATTDGPAHAACTFFGLDQIDSDLWWCWTAQCDGLVNVQTCGLTSVDTKIAVYDGCGPCPPTDAMLLACNDDACGSLQSQASFTAVNGQQYLIRVGTFPGAVNGIGAFQITDCTVVGSICTKSGNQCHGQDQSNASTSDNLAFNTADNFTPVASEDITGLCWWGTYATGVQPFADAFTVTYYADNLGVPGAVIASFAQGGGLTVNSVATGFQIAGVVPEFEYTGSHAAVPVVAGECYWVEIKNDFNIIGDRWFWEWGNGGDGISAQDGNPPNGYSFGERVPPDKAWCLTLASGVTTETCDLPPPPGNDDCGNAIAIAGPQTVNYDNSTATTDGPAHAACLFFGLDQVDNDMWWCWTAQCDGLTTVQTCGLTGTDTKIAVYNGCVCPPTDADLLACNDDACGGTLQSSVQFSAVNGQTYLIRVGNFPGAAGGASAFTISGCTIVGDICTKSGAQCHTQDQSNAATSDNLFFNSADNFTPVASENITDICWWGTYASGIQPALDAFTVTYYNDNFGVPGTPIVSFAQGAGLTVNVVATGFQIAGVVPEFEYTGSHAAVPVVAGQCYWIEIKNDFNTIGDRWFWEFGGGGDLIFAQDGDGANPPNGYSFGERVSPDLAWCLTLPSGVTTENCGTPPAPANDLCADAINIPGPFPATVSGTNVAGTPDAEAILCVTSYDGGPGVWYTVTGTGNTMTVDTCGAGTDYDTKLHVYCGSCGSFTCVSGNDDDFTFCVNFQSRLTFCSQAGVVYHILVSGFAGGAGNFDLNIADDGVPCIGAVECAPTGACCLPDDSCVITSEANCASLNGDYAGDGTPCSTSGGSPITYGPFSPNVAIPDGPGGTVSDTRNVADSRVIGDVNVTVEILHSWVGDLNVDITHVNSGTTVRLIERMQLVGGELCDLCCGCSADNMNVTLDDEAASPIESQCIGGLTGSFQPFASLSAFDGLNSASDWTITACDGAGQDIGTLVSWSITTDIAGGSTCPLCPGDRGDANCDGNVDFFDIDPFLLALFNLASYQSTFCGGSICAVDVDCSGNVDFFDIDPFLACLFSVCPPCP